jgi:hypothetical protein
LFGTGIGLATAGIVLGTVDETVGQDQDIHPLLWGGAFLMWGGIPLVW